MGYVSNTFHLPTARVRALDPDIKLDIETRLLAHEDRATLKLELASKLGVQSELVIFLPCKDDLDLLLEALLDLEIEWSDAEHQRRVAAGEMRCEECGAADRTADEHGAGRC